MIKERKTQIVTIGGLTKYGGLQLGGKSKKLTRYNIEKSNLTGKYYLLNPIKAIDITKPTAILAADFYKNVNGFSQQEYNNMFEALKSNDNVDMGIAVDDFNYLLGVERDLTDSNKDLAASKKRVAELENQLKEFEGVKKDLTTSKENLTGVKNELSELNKNFTRVENNLTDSNKDLAASKKRVAELENQLKEFKGVKKDLTTSKENLTRVKNELSELKNEFQEEKKALIAKIALLEKWKGLSFVDKWNAFENTPTYNFLVLKALTIGMAINTSILAFEIYRGFNIVTDVIIAIIIGVGLEFTQTQLLKQKKTKGIRAIKHTFALLTVFFVFAKFKGIEDVMILIGSKDWLVKDNAVLVVSIIKLFISLGMGLAVYSWGKMFDEQCQDTENE